MLLRMVEVIAQRELRNDVSKILARVKDGEEFVVTVNGEEVAELKPRRKLGGTASLFEALSKLPPRTPEQQARMDAIDDEIQNWPEDDRDPWERWG